jgi:hypothetical protein
MRKFLFILASTGSLTTMNAAIAQYAYYAPGYALGYYGPRYAPGYYARGYYALGYTWRDQRERATADWLLWQIYEKQRTTNDATYRASVGPTVGTNNVVDTGFVGECAKGFSEETCRRRGQKYNPPSQN